MDTERHIDIVFDGPPAPESGRFVEVEDETGKSVNIGQWLQRDDGFWVLRIRRHGLINPSLVTAPDERHRCCVLDDSDARCPNPSVFWSGKNGVDDYTYSCPEHLKDVVQDGDTVRILLEGER